MRTALCVTVLAAAAVAQATASLEEAEKLRERRMAAFAQYVEGLDVDTPTKAKVLKLREGATLGGEYGWIHQSLLLLHPAYARADGLLFNERFAAAAEAFAEMRDHEDPYVRTYAAYRCGLAEMNRDRYEEATAAFTDVLNASKKFSGCDVEAAFYLAVCLGQEREKERALVAANTFLRDYPEAPERYRKAMEQIRNELMQEWESPLYDLAGRMNHVARKIEGGDTGEPTREKQKEIVGILDELIKKAEQQEGQGQGQGGGGGGGPPRGNQQSNSPASESSAPPGASRTGELRPKPRAKPGDQWGMMRDKEREEVLQALKEKFPDRYRELLEQYHKALAEGKRVTVPAEER